VSKHGPRNWSTIRRPSPECQIYSRWTRPAAAPTRVNSTGEHPGTIPSFGCIAGVTAFLTLVHGPARIPVPQVLQMNCVPRSVWSTTPVGKLPRVVAAMSSAVMTRARVVRVIGHYVLLEGQLFGFLVPESRYFSWLGPTMRMDRSCCWKGDFSALLRGKVTFLVGRVCLVPVNTALCPVCGCPMIRHGRTSGL